MSEAVAAKPGLSAPTARTSMLSLSIKEKSALYAAYISHLKNGGIFVPSKKKYKLEDQVYILLTIMDDPIKIPITGRIAWITPENVQINREAGIGVHFSDDESGKSAKLKIENILGGAIKSDKITHTL